jgi:hypothetical protein
LDRIGLQIKIFSSVNAIYQGREWLDTECRESAGRISYNKGLSLALAAFKEVQAGAGEDLETLILIEEAFLTQELQFCMPTDKKAANSITNAIESFDEGLRALKEVEAGTSYSVVDRCLLHRKETRYNGMPKDSFHFACSGHKKRLDGVLHSPGINTTEKTVLEQRFSNIATAQDVYVSKQEKALGASIQSAMKMWVVTG